MKTMRSMLLFVPAALFLVSIGCVKHKVEAEPIEVKPIKVEPIHITIDVNVRVQEKLNDFFAFEDEIESAQ